MITATIMIMIIITATIMVIITIIIIIMIIIQNLLFTVTNMKPKYLSTKTKTVMREGPYIFMRSSVSFRVIVHCFASVVFSDHCP